MFELLFSLSWHQRLSDIIHVHIHAPPVNNFPTNMKRNLPPRQPLRPLSCREFRLPDFPLLCYVFSRSIVLIGRFQTLCLRTQLFDLWTIRSSLLPLWNLSIFSLPSIASHLLERPGISLSRGPALPRSVACCLAFL